MKAVINGISYEYEVIGSGEPLLLLHGFTGSKETWRRFVPSWSQQFQVIIVDLLGHGNTDSPDDPERYHIEKVAWDIVQLLTQIQVQRAHVLGYSMGGRLAITIACLYPERVQSLLLENCTAGLESEQERIERRQKDEELATSIEQQGVQAFINRWENIPLFATQKQLPEAAQERIRKQRLQNNAKGLANSLRGMGTGAQPSWWSELKQLQMPILLLSGEYDEKFWNILLQMKNKLPHAELVQISDAGHAIHVEQPEKFDTIVSGFLQNQF